MHRLKTADARKPAGVLLVVAAAGGGWVEVEGLEETGLLIEALEAQ